MVPLSLTSKRGRWLDLALCLLAPATAGCSDTHFSNPALVTRPRVLVVLATGPEARPGEAIELRAIVASPRGTSDNSSVVERWSFCTSARTPGDPASVAPECRFEPGLAIAEKALKVDTVLPRDACRRFGPEPPPGDFRAQDPDATGGYYQPVRLEAFGESWFHFQRLRCALPDAPAEVARDYATNYANNENPRIAELVVAGETVLGGDFAGADQGAPVPLRARPAAELPLELRFSSDTAEKYLWFDPTTRQLAERSEVLSVAWFVTAGSLASEWEAFAPDGHQVAAHSSWRAPAQPGRAFLWAVLRDDRGGSAAAHAIIDIEP